VRGPAASCRGSLEEACLSACHAMARRTQGAGLIVRHGRQDGSRARCPLRFHSGLLQTRTGPISPPTSSASLPRGGRHFFPRVWHDSEAVDVDQSQVKRRCLIDVAFVMGKNGTVIGLPAPRSPAQSPDCRRPSRNHLACWDRTSGRRCPGRSHCRTGSAQPRRNKDFPMDQCRPCRSRGPIPSLWRDPRYRQQIEAPADLHPQS
jgi:hypothetical protein